jgi:hypothetical protein
MPPTNQPSTATSSFNILLGRFNEASQEIASLTPFLVLDQNQFTQLGVTERIKAIEIYVNQQIYLLKERGERVTLLPHDLSEIHAIIRNQNLIECLNEFAIQIKQFSNGDSTLDCMQKDWVAALNFIAQRTETI